MSASMAGLGENAESATKTETPARFSPLRGIQFQSIAALVLLFALIAAGASAIIDRVGRPALENLASGLVSKTAAEIANQVYIDTTRAEAIATALARIGESSRGDLDAMRALAPGVMDAPGHEYLITGGGLWPEPFAFEAGKARASMFWARDNNGVLQPLEDYNAPDAADYHQEAWYVPSRVIRQRSCLWSGSYIDPYSQEPMVTCSVPMIVSERLLGVSTTDLRLSGLRSFLESAMRQADGYAFLADRDGKLLTYPDPKIAREAPTKVGTAGEYLTLAALAQRQPELTLVAELVGKKAADILTRAREAHGMEAAVAEIVAASNMVARRDAERIVAGHLMAAARSGDPRDEKPSQIRLDTAPFIDTAAIATVFYLPKMQWYLVLIVPEAIILEPAEIMTADLLILLLGLMLASLLLMFLFLRGRVLSPLARINASVAEGRDAELVEFRVGSAEIVSLAHRLGGHALKLQQALRKAHEATRRVMDLNDDLEHRVEDRTRQLKISRDELAETLKNLRIAQNELIHAEKMASLGSLVAGVAHEINTPVGACLTMVTAARERLDQLRDVIEGGKVKRKELLTTLDFFGESTDLITQNLMRASSLVTTFKSVAADQSSENRQRFNCSELLREVAQTVRHGIQGKAIDIIIDLPADIVLDSYPGPFAQTMTNLFSNAVTHGFADLDRGKVSVTLLNRGRDEIEIAVANDGYPIPEAIRSRIFDPFFSTARLRVGSGLGLHITYNIVTQILGGRIQLDDGAETGARFLVALPLRAPNRANGDETAAAPSDIKEEQIADYRRVTGLVSKEP